MKFKECHYFTSACLSRQLNKIAEKAFSDLKLAPSQAYILTCVADEAGIDCKGLANTMLLAPSSLTRMIDKLEAMGYLRREVQGRCCVHHITAKGQALIPQIEAVWGELEHVFSSLFDDELRQRLSTAINDAIKAIKKDDVLL
ncbi:MAG: hypothetical protein RL662_403 [Bacteroidota bacterium]|jgi:DNA-binding MarR family transcriptional regulator